MNNTSANLVRRFLGKTLCNQVTRRRTYTHSYQFCMFVTVTSGRWQLRFPSREWGGQQGAGTNLQINLLLCHKVARSRAIRRQPAANHDCAPSECWTSVNMHQYFMVCGGVHWVRPLHNVAGFPRSLTLLVVLVGARACMRQQLQPSATAAPVLMQARTPTRCCSRGLFPRSSIVSLWLSDG